MGTFSTAKNLVGKQFGRLTVIERAGKDKFRHVIWKCKCECGNYINIVGYSLERGQTTSCGCYRKEKSIERFTIHNMRNSRIYYIWRSMRMRCNNQKNSSYKNYGGRGIKVCKEWNESFESFYEWAVQNGYSEDLSIDRIDCNGNYEPSNCRWADIKTQANNKRNNHKITIDNVTKNLKEWCDYYELNRSTVYRRIAKGLPQKYWFYQGQLPRKELILNG